MNLGKFQYMKTEESVLLEHFKERAVQKKKCIYQVSYREHSLCKGNASCIKEACRKANEAVEALRHNRIYEGRLFVKIFIEGE